VISCYVTLAEERLEPLHLFDIESISTLKNARTSAALCPVRPSAANQSDKCHDQADNGWMTRRVFARPISEQLPHRDVVPVPLDNCTDQHAKSFSFHFHYERKI
jgi:hypothetical protein